MKPIVLRVAAESDAGEAADYYAVEAGQEIADRFADALEAAYRLISRQPGTGSPRWGDLLDLAGLRSRPVGRFPYLAFYVEHTSEIEVWRVLHARSDLYGTLLNEAAASSS